jgi:hypothetical protein
MRLACITIPNFRITLECTRTPALLGRPVAIGEQPPAQTRLSMPRRKLLLSASAPVRHYAMRGTVNVLAEHFSVLPIPHAMQAPDSHNFG